MIGDAYTTEQAEKYNKVIDELQEQHPYKQLIVVPKSEDVFKALSGDLTLGVPVGYSKIQAGDLGWYHYRGHDTHILGSAPDKQYAAMQKLTQPTLDGREPANIKGVDWNGFFRPAFAEPGEYWTPNGWEQDHGASTRETVRNSMKEIKQFWQEKELWPETEPCEIYGDAITEPDEMIFMDQGGNPISSRKKLEHAVVEEFDGYGELAFTSETARNWFEYRSGLLI